MGTSNATAHANSLLAYLREFRPNRLYALAPLEIVQEALKDFEAETVRGFRWVEEGEILLADVQKRPRSGKFEEVCFALEAPRLLATCSCPARTGCRHITTALMVVARLLRNARFTSHRLDPDLRDLLFDQLQAAPSDGGVDAPSAEGVPVPDLICARRGARGELRLYRRRKRHGRASKRMALPDDLEAILTNPVDGTVLESAVREWWPLVCASREFRFGIETESGIACVGKADVRPVEGYVSMRTKGDRVAVASGVRFVDGTCAEEICRIGEHLVFLPATSELVWLVNDTCWDRLETLTRASPVVTDADWYFRNHEAIAFEASEFNRRGWSVPSDENLAELRLVPPDTDGFGPPVWPARKEIEIDFDEEFDGMMLVPRVVVDERTALPVAVEVLDFMKDARELATRAFFEEHERAARSAVFAMLLGDDGVLDRMRAEDAFSDADDHRQLRRYVQEVADYLAFQRETALHVSETRMEEDQPWGLVKDAIPAGAVAVAVLGSVMEGHGEWESACFRGSPRDIFDRLQVLLEACQKNGVALKYRSQLVKAGELSVAVCAESEKIDGEKIHWFEVRPEVKCEAFEIPQEQWDEILRSWFAPVCCEGAPAVRFLNVRSVEALERLKHVWDRARDGEDGDGTLKIPRLQILDWMQMAHAGIRLELPEEERAVVEALLSFKKMKKACLPKGIDAKLRPYQKQGYQWLAFHYEHRFGACLADDMGLGKTLQAITLMAAIAEGRVPGSNDCPHLIVLPPTLVFNWHSEIERFCPALRVAEYLGPKRSTDFAGADVVLTTYELVRRDIETLKKISFDVAIFDEAQAVKNYEGARSKAVRQLDARFRLCLTGTPLENHIGEYYSIIELALPGLLGERKQFLVDSRRNPESLQLCRARPFVLRRTKEKILKELPPKVEADVYFDLTKRQKEVYTRTVEEVKLQVAAMFEGKSDQQAGIAALAALTRLRQVCISPRILDASYEEESPKIGHLCTQLEELVEEGRAALVFSQFTRALDLLNRALEKRGIAYQRMDGKTPTESRKKLVGDFQNGEGPGIFLISLKTGGAGLNLTRAEYVFHFDPWWNPAVENQASDRAHRIGQKQTVFVNRLLMRHTIEEKMMELKKRKQALYDQIMGSAEERAGAKGGGMITREDFEFLLEG